MFEATPGHKPLAPGLRSKIKLSSESFGEGTRAEADVLTAAPKEVKITTLFGNED